MESCPRPPPPFYLLTPPRRRPTTHTPLPPQKALGDRFKIQGFPTLKFFRGSDASASEYGGGRTADEITAWVTKKSGPSTVAVESRAAADELVASSSVVFVGVFGEDASALRAAFEAEAAKSEDSVFAVAPQSAAGEFGGEGVVALNNFEGQEHAVRYGGAAEAEELGAFVAANSLPLVVPFSQKTVQKIFAGAIKTHFLLFAAPGAPEVAGFRAVAAEGSGKMLFVTVAPEEEGNDKVLQYFGVTAADIPAAAIVNMAGSGMKKFMLPAGEVTEGGLREFAAKFNAGSLKPSLKSEKPTADKDDVRVLVGENFEELVLNGPEEVSLVEFYAPWCGHCKSLAPKWLSLATHYKKEARVGIFNMDYTANEIDHPDVNVKGFPTVRGAPPPPSSPPIYLSLARRTPLTPHIKHQQPPPPTLTADHRLREAGLGSQEGCGVRWRA